MGRAVKKKTGKLNIEAAARKAAEEAIEEMESEVGSTDFDSPEDRDISFASEESHGASEQELDARNVWLDAPKLAQARGLGWNTRIYLNGDWIGTKKGAYHPGWDGIWEENKAGGSFKAVAVDSNNKFLTSQTIQIAPHPDWIKAQERLNNPSERNEPSGLEMIELMKDSQREAESRNQNQQSGLASVMASMVQMQTQSSQMMMQMFQKSAEQTQNLLIAMMQQSNAPKGPDPVITLLTTMITQKPKDVDGFTTQNVLKMVQDAEGRAEAKAVRNAELIEKKSKELAETLAEAMASGEGEEEKGIPGLIKGFMPVLAQVMAQQTQNTQATQELQARAQAEELRRQQQLQARRNAQARLPAQPAKDGGALTVVKSQAAPSGLREQHGTGTDSGTVALTPEVLPPLAISLETLKNAAEGQNIVPIAQGPVIDDRLKGRIFAMCLPDIGNAMQLGAGASITGRTCLEKLEKEGYSRQTVAKLFSLEDFYGYSDKYGLPAELAKPWLKEFHESIVQSAAQPPSPKPNGPSPGQGTGATVTNGPAGKPTAVAPGRSQQIRRQPGQPPRPNPKDL